jgi:hypothetical protein
MPKRSQINEYSDQVEMQTRESFSCYMSTHTCFSAAHFRFKNLSEACSCTTTDESRKDVCVCIHTVNRCKKGSSF